MSLPSEKAIVKAVSGSRRGPIKPKSLARVLKVPQPLYRAFRERLREMERAGKLYRVKGGRYAPPERISLVTGRLTLIRAGDGFVRSDSDGGEVFVSQRHLESAMDGDRVVVRIESRPRGLKPVGRIIKVLERARETLVGIFHEGRKMGFVVPLDPRVANDIAIPWGEEGKAQDGDVVVVGLVQPPGRRSGPIGSVEQVLGRLEDPGVDVLTVIHGHGLPLVFPAAVEAEVRAISATVEASAGREDMRDVPVFTIDPADARDHDDALSWEPLPGGGSRVGIHIADVSHYVPSGGALDQEALDRGTSVYLVDRVIPMLPHRLSSDLCSLRVGEDRYAVSLLVDVSSEGVAGSHRFVRSVIRSRAGLSYERAQALLAGADVVASEAELIEPLRELWRIGSTLIEGRARRGALDFELPEGRVVLDDSGAPTEVQAIPRLNTHRLVEAFMLLANELVARMAQKRELPVLYRIHEPPSEERLEQLREVVGRFGIRVPRRVRHPEDLATVLRQAEGTAFERLVSNVVLRSMQRARYSHELEGHFGLALSHYSHFTSPIRRYPDLVTHRALVSGLLEAGDASESPLSDLGSIAEHTSWREQVATAAERESVEMKKIEYLRRHVGDTMEGTISGVRAFGAFVQLDDVFVDGLIHVNGLRDDYYDFDERSMALIGARAGRTLRLGDRVRVRISRVDKEERKIDLLLAEEGQESP